MFYDDEGYGLGQELIEESMIDAWIRQARIEVQAEKGIWTTKDGERIHITKMSDSHLKNAIRRLEEQNVFDKLLPWITVMEKELERRKNKGFNPFR